MVRMICSLLVRLLLMLFFFFFQAEDGIRDLIVTGVQTCALPISPLASDIAQFLVWWTRKVAAGANGSALSCPALSPAIPLGGSRCSPDRDGRADRKSVV